LLHAFQLAFQCLVAVVIQTVSKVTAEKDTVASQTRTPEYFNLRPKLEKDYGYSHAVKIGDDLKISGAVSMDDSGIIVAPGSNGATDEKLLQ
jgi:hypothetical protein